jgi:hypothetical protein
MPELATACLLVIVDTAQSLEKPLPEGASNIVSREPGPVVGDIVLRVCSRCKVECEFLEEEDAQPRYTDDGLVRLKAGCLAIEQKEMS